MTNRLLSFARLAFGVAQRSVPDHRHRFAPKRYTQPQLLACVLPAAHGGREGRPPLSGAASNTRRANGVEAV